MTIKKTATTKPATKKAAAPVAKKASATRGLKKEPATVATVKAPEPVPAATPEPVPVAGTAAPVEVPAALNALDHFEKEARANDEAIAAAVETPAPEAVAQAAAAPGAVTADEAQAGALIQSAALVYGAAGLIEKKYDFITIDADAKQNLAEKLAPVLLKHNAGMPEWLLPYKEEFALAVSLGGVAFGVYLQYAAHQEELAKMEAERARREEEERKRQQQGANLTGHQGGQQLAQVTLATGTDPHAHMREM